MLEFNLVLGLLLLDLRQVLDYNRQKKVQGVEVADNNDEAEEEYHEDGLVSIRQSVHNPTPVISCYRLKDW